MYISAERMIDDRVAWRFLMRREAQNEKDRDGENDNSLTNRNRVPMIATYFSSALESFMSKPLFNLG
jgi:hypothetical protein